MGVAASAGFNRIDTLEARVLRKLDAVGKVEFRLVQLRMADPESQRKQQAQSALARVVVRKVSDVGQRAGARRLEDPRQLFGMLRGASVVLDDHVNVPRSAVGNQRLIRRDGRGEI